MNWIKSLLFYFILPISFLAFLYWYGFGDKTAPLLVLENRTIGEIGRLSVKVPEIEKTFSLLNDSDENVTIAKIYTDCRCLSAFIYDSSDQKIGPFELPEDENTRPIGIVVSKGKKVRLSFIFMPGSLSVGAFQGRVFVEDTEKRINAIKVNTVLVK